MKKLNKISVLFLLIAVLWGSAPAQAVGWVDYWFSRDHDFKPYLQNGIHPHNAQWRRESWTVVDWAPTPAAGYEQLDKFFRAGIFTKYTHKSWLGSPTLTVGQGFYHLSGYDQRRTLELFDHIYGATRSKAGTIYLVDPDTDRTIGLYTRAGLQLE